MSAAKTVTITLELAGVPFRVRVEGPCQRAHLDARFGAYYAPAAAAPIDVVITVVPDYQPPRPVQATFPAADVERLPGGRLRFQRPSDELVYDPEARVARGVARGLPAALPPVVDPTVVDTPLRLLLAYELPRREGLLVHASGYADARGAALFAAVSGGGKTTTARKMPPAHVLSDDQVALRRDAAGRWWACALPFVGEYQRATRPQQAPLRALVLLRKGPEVKLLPLRPVAALPRILGCVVYFVRDDPAVGGLLDLATDLLARTAAHALVTTREAPLAPVLDALLD